MANVKDGSVAVWLGFVGSSKVFSRGAGIPQLELDTLTEPHAIDRTFTLGLQVMD